MTPIKSAVEKRLEDLEKAILKGMNGNPWFTGFVFGQLSENIRRQNGCGCLERVYRGILYAEGVN